MTAERRLDEGDEFVFKAEHVIDIDIPPRDYLIEKYGDRLAFEDSPSNSPSEPIV